MDSRRQTRTIDTEVLPENSLEAFSQVEVEQLLSEGEGGLHGLLRRCILAVLNTGSDTDDTRAVLDLYRDFRVNLVQQDRGLKIVLNAAPPSAFVDGHLIRGIREMLFAVLRDMVYIGSEIHRGGHFCLEDSHGITNAVFHILRNARMFERAMDTNLVVCWGGHAIGREEYDYTKKVGYELGLRGLNVCTGCGPGAMKGPMKGATIGHAKQRIRTGRYVGITEPGIIAAESPNPIVSNLVIMPDMEKRLEAFVRTGHGMIVFPGGVGTAEEILYLLGILLHPDNAGLPLPVIMTGPKSAEPYLQQMDRFVAGTLGDAVRDRYRIIIDDPETVGRTMQQDLQDVYEYRRANNDAYYYNWRLRIDHDFQIPFSSSHEDMAAARIDDGLPVHELAANLRRIFSGIVAGNLREDVMAAIERQGPFHIRGSARIMGQLDGLLATFVSQGRMKISGDYQPCYEIRV